MTANVRDQRAAKKDLPLQKSVAAAPLHHIVMRRYRVLQDVLEE